MVSFWSVTESNGIGLLHVVFRTGRIPTGADRPDETTSLVRPVCGLTVAYGVESPAICQQLCV